MNQNDPRYLRSRRAASTSRARRRAASPASVCFGVAGVMCFAGVVGCGGPQTPAQQIAPAPVETPAPQVSAPAPRVRVLSVPDVVEPALVRRADQMVLELDTREPAESLALVTNDDGQRVLSLRVRGCQFVDVEPYTRIDAVAADACQRANHALYGERAAVALVVEAGPWTVRLINDNDERSAGIWLRPAGVMSFSAVNLAGIPAGQSGDATAELTPGVWHYSDPNAPTADYTLVVRAVEGPDAPDAGTPSPVLASEAPPAAPLSAAEPPHDP